MDVFSVVLILILAALLLYTLHTLRTLSASGPQAGLSDLAEMKGMIQSFQSGLQNNLEVVRQSMEDRVASLERKLEASLIGLDQRITIETRTVQDRVDARIAELNQRLNSNVEAVRSAVDHNFTALTGALTALNEQLGKLEGYTAQLPTVAEGISSLQRTLFSPQSRGRLGEILLQHLLADALPREYYELQHELEDGLKVDAVIFIPDRDGRRLKLPIDAKFPSGLSGSPKEAQAALVEHAKGRMKEVEKYLNRGPDVLPMAFCYIPSEGLFQMLVEAAPDLVQGGAKGVVLVSPGMLYLYLKMVIVGATTMAIEEQIHTVVRELYRLKDSLADLEDSFHTLQKHITNASNRASEVGTKLASWQERLARTLDQIPLTALPRPGLPDQPATLRDLHGGTHAGPDGGV